MCIMKMLESCAQFVSCRIDGKINDLENFTEYLQFYFKCASRHKRVRHTVLIFREG